jgi:uncharacterized protein (DUF1330 family)
MKRRYLPLLACGALGALVGAGAALHAANSPTPKAYFLVEIEVKDPATFQTYASQTTPILTKYGGRYLARGGIVEGMEGAPPAGRIVVVEFPSVDAARGFYNSPEYKAIAEIRKRSATTRAILVEGLPPETR